ncbi:MAG TPA: hypothetical protein VGK74_15500 [Symbiobacteriaceae bacterium]
MAPRELGCLQQFVQGLQLDAWAPATWAAYRRRQAGLCGGGSDEFRGRFAG